MSAPTEEQPREGWAMPRNAKRFHYFRDYIALCRRWMFAGVLDSDGGQFGEKPQSTDCRPCWRLRKKELTR